MCFNLIVQLRIESYIEVKIKLQIASQLPTEHVAKQRHTRPSYMYLYTYDELLFRTVFRIMLLFENRTLLTRNFKRSWQNISKQRVENRPQLIIVMINAFTRT